MMTRYRYHGITRFGKRVKGEMDASSIRALEQKLNASGIDVVSYKMKRSKISLSFMGQRLKRQDIMLITAQLGQLLSSGLPLIEAIDDLSQSYEDDRVRNTLSSIYETMKGGESFSEALLVYEKEFGRVYIALVAIGEKTGKLAQVMTDLEGMLDWEEKLAEKAKKIMVYPAIVSVVVLVVLSMMMVFVVPQLIGFIKEMGGQLGLMTNVMIGLSDFMASHFPALIFWFLTTIIGAKLMLKRSNRLRVNFDRWLFSIKVIGPVLYKLKIARISRSLAIMYAAGMTFTQSLRLSLAVTGNAYLERCILSTIRMIEEGMPIHLAFKQSELFPVMAIRMVKVGEKSGHMDQALFHVGDYYDMDAKRTIDRVEPAIEPVLTVIMAAIVGWVMMAVLGPIYDTISGVQ